MANKTYQIKIESILGGQAPTTHFAAPDQYRAALGIDPSLPILNSLGDSFLSQPSGLLRPVCVTSAGTTASYPKWIVSTPKDENNFYIYDASGSVYTTNDTFSATTGLGDLNDGGGATGNGAAYYDNYVYFARSTTIARYGPLDGTAVFTDDYWVGTLGLTALSNTTYPVDFDFTTTYPNHVMHRHSDGKLYVADIVDNKGTIHYVSTTKTTVEGDTDNGSTYNKVQVGYGLWPMAMESYGDLLVIAFIELKKASGNRTVKGPRAKIAFWDTTSTNVNQITWVEFPDQMITALKNVNGVLYVVSGNQYTEGFRVSRYVGGYTFESVAFFETGQPSPAGAVDGIGEQLFFGSFTYIPEVAGCVYSLGLRRPGLSNGLFNIASVYGVDSDGNQTEDGVFVTALNAGGMDQGAFLYTDPVIGYARAVGFGGVGHVSTQSGKSPSTWWSQVYKVGQPFKITKIRIPLANAASTNVSIVPKLYTDDFGGSGSEYTLRTIGGANNDNASIAVIRPTEATGAHSFWLELRWTGTTLCTVSLPITIEYELIDD